MEQDESDQKGSSSADRPVGVRGDGSGAANPAAGGRHDILETENVDPFWPEVDGMLTGEFSADLLPKAGDYRLGALDEDLDPEDLDMNDPSSLPPPPPNPPGPAPAAAQTATPFDANDLPPVSETDGQNVRGAHDIDPDQIGFNVIAEPAQADFGSFVPDLGSGPFAPSKGDAPQTELIEGQSKNAAGLANQATSAPQVSTASTRLFDELGELPPVAEDDGGRLFPPKRDLFRDAAPIGGLDALDDTLPPGSGLSQLDLTNELQQVSPSMGPPPVSLERSTVVDPSRGTPAGSSFLDEAADHYGQAGRASAGLTVNLQDVGPARPAALVRAPDKATVQRRDMLLDIVDRQWFTSALVAGVAVLIGVVGWIVFLSSSGQDTQIVASPATADGAPSSPQGAGAGAPARSEEPNQSSSRTTLRASTTTASTLSTGPSRSLSTAGPATVRPTAAPTTTTTEAPSTTVPTTAVPSSTGPSSTVPSTTEAPPTTPTTTPTTPTTPTTTTPTTPTTPTTEASSTTEATTESSSTEATTEESTPSSEELGGGSDRRVIPSTPDPVSVPVPDAGGGPLP